MTAATGGQTGKARLQTVKVGSAPIGRYQQFLDKQGWADLVATMDGLSKALQGRIVWNVNSTARGGGVAELLSQLIQYDRGVGIDERWLVIEGSPDFFGITKRIHTLLHGAESDGADITARERSIYEGTMARNAAAMVETVGPNDVVIVHDPQAAGLVPALAKHGAHVIWRSHVGVDQPNEIVRNVWDFLGDYLGAASAYVFSRQAYVWDGLDPSRVHIIPPCIDPFAVKNQELDGKSVSGILKTCGIVDGTEGENQFTRSDGRAGRVTRPAKLEGEAMPFDAHFMMQVSRWDRLKDPVGVIETFANHVAPGTDSWLVLAGPASTSVRDDPEEPEILSQVVSKRQALEPSVRRRVLIAQLPMEDGDENAAIVNALQRRANVVVQKSLAEGFGLTVAEAMWKERPVVASRVGGIQDQIEDGSSGLLIDDPEDLAAFGEAVVDLIRNRSKADDMGREARKRIAGQYLAPRLLMQQAGLINKLVA